MATATQEVLDFANHLADIAAPIAMEFFRRNPSVRTKADGTIVTQADEAVEAALRAEIAATYPAHVVWGEEQGDDDSASSAPRWILDPIDGTINYASGIPIWATLIAHEVDGSVVAGVVGAPALGERYAALLGAGATLNFEPIHVSDVSDLASAAMSYGTLSHFDKYGLSEPFLKLARSVRHSRGFGDFWGHMLVASGSIDFMIEPVVSPWDVAAVMIVVTEAGGAFSGLDGTKSYRSGNALSSNGAIHEAVLSVIQGR